MYFGDLQQGSSGAAVKQLQQALEALGYSVGSAGIDGVYGPATAAAVRQFQQAAGITVDGIYGPKTQSKMAEALTSYETAYNTSLPLPSTGSGSAVAASSGIQLYPTSPTTQPTPVGSAGTSKLIWVGVGLLGLAVAMSMGGKKR